MRKGASRAGVQPQTGSIFHQYAGSSMGGIGAAKVAQNPLHFAFFREGNGHVEAQAHHVPIKLSAAEQVSEIVQVLTANIEPPPEPDPLDIDTGPLAAK